MSNPFDRIVLQTTPQSLQLLRYLITFLMFAVMAYGVVTYLYSEVFQTRTVLFLFFTTFVALMLLLWILTYAQSRLYSIRDHDYFSQSLPAAERQTARSADSLVRQFKERVQQEVDAAAERLGSESDKLIKEKIGERINSQLGPNLISVLGKKLAAQIDSTSQLESLKRDVSDRFIQMRNRALEYAGAAETQSRFFRYTGFFFAAIGLGTLGFVFISTYIQYRDHPELYGLALKWETIVLRHGPSYAFVALNEFLALIMFRYQSKALEYMRYFSNEATNIDARHVGVEFGLRFVKEGRGKIMEKMIDRLVATERNFVIAKGQKTLESANNESEDRLIERIAGRIGRGWDDGDESPKRRSKARRIE